MTMVKYWINQDGVQEGPLTFEELKAKGLTRDAYVWREGLAEWVPVSSLAELTICLLPAAEVSQPALSSAPEVLPEAHATAAGKALGFPDSWKGIWKVDPLFAVEASEEETLARWPDGSAAVAVHKAGDGYEVFCGIPALPTKVLAGFAKLAGCRFYAEPDTAYVRVAEGEVFVEPLDDGLLKVR